MFKVKIGIYFCSSLFHFRAFPLPAGETKNAFRKCARRAPLLWLAAALPRSYRNCPERRAAGAGSPSGAAPDPLLVNHLGRCPSALFPSSFLLRHDPFSPASHPRDSESRKWRKSESFDSIGIGKRRSGESWMQVEGDSARFVARFAPIPFQNGTFALTLLFCVPYDQRPRGWEAE